MTDKTAHIEYELTSLGRLVKAVADYLIRRNGLDIKPDNDAVETELMIARNQYVDLKTPRT